MTNARVRVGMAPRSQPFDASVESLRQAMCVAQDAGIKITFEKVLGGAPGFQNACPIMAHMIADGDTHLFFAADDVLYPPDTILRLVNADKDAICGIYRKSCVTNLEPANYSESAEEFLRRFKEGGIYETKFASAHSLTIKRHVIEKMMADYPELAFHAGNETQYALFLPMIHEGKCYQDDWSFSIRARQSGFTLWDDFGCRLQHHCSAFLGFESLENL